MSVLEAAVRREFADCLADPERILAEAERLNGGQVDTGRRESVARELAAVEEQQRRLVRLYTAGTLPEDVLNDESARLALQRATLQAEQGSIRTQAPVLDVEGTRANLTATVGRLRERIENAPDDKLQLMLEATDAQITASAEELQVSGVLPALSASEQSYNRLVTIEQTSGSPFRTHLIPAGIPFRLSVALSRTSR